MKFLKRMLRLVYVVVCPFPTFRQNIGHRILNYIRAYMCCIIRMPSAVKMLSDIDYKLNLLCDYYFDVTKVRSAGGGLREFQKSSIALLAKFIEVCEANNVEYWLDFGSLLGAYRHAGFVPWDDDVDVSMTLDSMAMIQKYKDEFSRFGMRLIDWWIPGKMCRLVFSRGDKIGAFLDIYGYEKNASHVKFALPGNVREVVPIPNGVMFPLGRLKFEGLDVYTPKLVEKYLGCRYGNYMTFPHHVHDEQGHVEVNPYINFDE